MAKVSIVEALADCLETMRKGEADMEICLNRYPAYRTQLRALLEVTSLIRPLPEDVTPSPKFRERARQRILWQEGEGPGANLSLDADPGRGCC
jgi:hypothetical protein